MQVVSDVAFIQDDSRNLLVIAGSSDNDAVLVDMDDGFRTRKLALSENAESTSAGNRQVEWAVGTDYVWINGGQTKEMYILEVRGRDIDGARVARTIAGVPDGKAVFVRNYARDAERCAEESAVSQVRAKTAIRSEKGDNTRTITAIAMVVGCVALAGVLYLGVMASKPAAVKAVTEAGGVESALSNTCTLGSKNVA